MGKIEKQVDFTRFLFDIPYCYGSTHLNLPQRPEAGLTSRVGRDHLFSEEGSSGTDTRTSSPSFVLVQGLARSEGEPSKRRP